MKLLAKLFAVVLLGMAGAFVYVWYQTNQTVERALAALAPHAQISYGGIISSVYPGILGVSDVTIFLEGKRLQADALTVHAETIFDLYTLQQNPAMFLVKHPRLEIRGLTSPQALRKYELLENPFAIPAMETVMTLDAVGCGARSEISHTDLQAMGYGPLSRDINLHSGPAPLGNGWEVELAQQIQGLADYTMNVNLDTSPRSVAALLDKLGRLEFNSVTLQARDQGYNPRLHEFCAEELGISVAAYQARHLRAVQRHLRTHKAIVDADMLASYQDGLHRGARMRLLISPRKDFKLEDFDYYKPQHYAELLGIRFNANNKATGFGGATAAGELQQAATATPDDSSFATSADAGDPQAANTKLEPLKTEQAYSLEWDDLPQAVNDKIVVHTDSGGTHRGRLQNVDNYSLVLEKAIGAGSLQFSIDRRRFASAERARQDL